MDSWTLQGDSYSFLRSAPRTFSLRHRDGTPNHVEIFDITNIPSNRSAISETTCLCDIFGDDSESPSLSGSPASGSFVSSQRELDRKAATSPLVDDSSGSYHTAHGSSEGEEGFEDSKERLQSPTLQKDNCEQRQSEGQRVSPEHPGISKDISTTLKSEGVSPSPQLNTGSPLPEVLSSISKDRTPSPRYNRHQSLSPEGRVSSLSSSSLDTRSSLSSPNPRQTHLAAELQGTTPKSRDRRSSSSHPSITESPSPEPRHTDSSSSEPINPTSLRDSCDFGDTEARNISPYSDSSPSPEPSYTGYSTKSTPATFEARVILCSPSPSLCSAEIYCRETSSSPEVKNRSCSPETQASSPFPELRGRVSLPDLFSRGSTPDIEASTCTPEPIFPHSATAEHVTTTPENQGSIFPAAPAGVSTPAPRYTHPPPVTPLAPSPEIREISVSPEVRCAILPHNLLSTISPIARTPSPAFSPDVTERCTPSESKHPALTPRSFEVRNNCSPVEPRYTAVSPEIKITTSSPGERRRKSSDRNLSLNSLDFHFDSISPYPRSLTASPQITGISYSVVQPEDRDSSPYPELCRLCTPSGRTHLSPEPRSPTPNRTASSPHIKGFTCATPELELPKHPTPSPGSQYHIPPPELRHQTPLSERQHTPSESSPLALSPEPIVNQLPPVSPSTEANSECTPSCFTGTADVEDCCSSPDITGIQYRSHSAEDRERASSDLKREANTLGADLDNSSSVVKSPSHSLEPCTSPLSSKEEHISPGQQSTYREITAEEIYDQNSSCEAPIDNTCTTAEKQGDSAAVIPKPVTHNNSPVELKTPSLNLSVSLNSRSLNTSPALEATDSLPVQKVENIKPTFTAYSPNHKSGESDIFLKPDCTPGRQPTPKVGSETRERLTGNMAHHVNRKQSTSPPLTRFTPVHIIAPEKPYRTWQNRECGPPQVAASPPTCNVKKLLTNRESPSATLHNSNSQAHWLMWERDLGIEREEAREKERVMAGEMEMERGRKREERMHKRGERRHGSASYRGEQVELSFSARNRKGPRSHSTTPTSREAQRGMPTARSYSESLLATRQLQQQQILPRAQISQQDPRAVGPNRRLQSAAPQGKSTAPGRSFTNRPCQSSSSSMGSELDDTDNEVKWFTDVAFSSLSSPEVDYLDMYNSSHRSSTNISQPSTQESPAGANAAWLAYADFKGSVPRLDNEDFPLQQPSMHYSDGLDPTRRYEMGSFECVDVAVEREDSRKGKRGVPKRQIQLKRKNTTESKQDGGSGNSSPVTPVIPDSPLPERGSKETLIRQHSTPAAMQGCRHFEPSPEPIEKNSERRSKLQKAASLDETCTKTKMATCLIKSVLSKKMQSTDKQSEGQKENPAAEDIIAPSQSVEALSRSCLQHSSEDLSVAIQPSQTGAIRPKQNFGVKPSNSPSPNTSHTSFTLSQTDSHVTYSHCRNTVTGTTEKRSELMVPFNRKQHTEESVIPKNEGKQTYTTKRWEERKSGDSAKASSGNMGATFAIGDSNRTQDRMRHQECVTADTEDNKQFQQSDKSTYKTSEITLKASVEKKKTSLNFSLTPEVEQKPQLHQDFPLAEISPRQKEERVEATDKKTEEEEMGNGNNKAKGPIHKVRDVRRLVKNTYNLSFKSSSVSLPSPENEESNQNKDDEKNKEIKVESEKETIEKNTEAVEELTREGMAEGVNEEEPKEQRKEEWMAEAKNTELQTLSPPMQRKGEPPSRPQPMQIECKAVCWKEDKIQMTPGRPADKSHASPQLSVETDREPENSCYESTHCYTTGDTATVNPCQPNMNVEAQPQHTEQQTQKKADNENKPEVVSKDRKPLMLGSLPKLPSKEREVSTAVVVIRDGSTTSASQADDEITSPIQAPPSPGSSSSTTPDGSGHSVSMLLKEKGYQADIGAVVGEAQSSAGVKGVPCKHVNRLEIPLQSCTPPDGGVTESQRERTFSSSSCKSGPTAPSETTETISKNKPTVKDKPKQICISPVTNTQQQTISLNEQKEQGQYEAVKRNDPTFPPRSPALRRFRPQSIEVKSLSKETQKQETTTNNRPQTIEVKSIANHSQKPVVPPKPNYKFNPDTGSLPNQAHKSTEPTARVKPQSEYRPQTIVVSSPTIYRKLSSDSTSSNHTRKLAVSTVSSYRPPQSKTTTATISSLSNLLTASSETETSNDRSQQPGHTPQSPRNTQSSTSLGTDTRSASGPAPTSAPVPAPVPTANQLYGPASGVASQLINQAAVVEVNSQPQYPRQEQAVPVASHNIKHPAAVFAPLAPGYTHTNQPYHRSLSNERSNRTDDLRFYASDDPPSYDERESFSPLMLPDLPPRKPHCYHPSSRPPPCSCTSGCLAHPHHHHSPHNLTPPAPSHSPGQTLPYGVGQPLLRPHQCRADPQPLSYQPSSPKLTPLGPSQPPGMYQPLSQPPSYPPHPAPLQSCPAERPLQPHQHMEARRPPVHRSPQQQPPGVVGGPYSDHGHGHSPGLPPLDPQYLCGPQGLGPSYGSEYGGDSSSLYSESGYGQTPRRVLMDPETGKYFYIEVPVQPLRKMLFDPETGQYVEVLIPQQAMSHSGLYPPSAAPYQPLHNPNIYAPPSQYMPYVAPQHSPHHQAQAQPPRHPEASAPAPMHQNGPGVGYGSQSGQGPKLDPQTHLPLDQSYLESMYYVPTGMNASPNPTTSDCFHKHPATLPNAGGKRS